jgi:hypothetical protein
MVDHIFDMSEPQAGKVRQSSAFTRLSEGL